MDRRERLQVAAGRRAGGRRAVGGSGECTIIRRAAHRSPACDRLIVGKGRRWPPTCQKERRPARV